MDSKEILHYAQQIEKLHRECNYDSILHLLKTIESVDIKLEQLQDTGIAKVLYQVLKSCPVASVKKASKLLFSKWKKLYTVSSRVTENCSKLKKSIFRERCLCFCGFDSPSAASSDCTSCVCHDERGGCQCPNHTTEEGDDVLGQSVLHLVAGQHITLGRAGISKDSETLDIDRERNTPLVSSELSLIDSPSVSIKMIASNSKDSPPYRSKCFDLILQALTQNSTDTSAVGPAGLRDLARKVEEHIFTLHGRNEQKYKASVRSKVSNLRNPKNTHLHQGLISGELSPESFARMSVMEMASKELKQFRAECTEFGISRHQMPGPLEGAPTNKVRCRRCDGFDCSVTQVSRGTLFLPTWVRSGGPDDNMVTFVTCKGCGQQWYHSGWVCL